MQQQRWHLTEVLIFFHVAVFLLAQGGEQAVRALALFPGQVLTRPWSVVTYQLVPTQGVFWFLISMFVLWIMARPLEEEWGSPRFALFWLVSTFGAAAGSLLTGYPLAGNVFLAASLLFTFATVYPDVEFLVFFVLPVKVKWLALIGGGFLVLNAFQMGLGSGALHVIGMSAGYLFFLATRKLPSRRKLKLELKAARNRAAASAETSSIEARNRAWDQRVRDAETRAQAGEELTDADRALLAELDSSVDPSITVCAPADFGYTDDDVCRSCPGFAECAARRIRMAAGEHEAPDRAKRRTGRSPKQDKPDG
jgi:membrane associated rhomboid family serine protease